MTTPFIPFTFEFSYIILKVIQCFYVPIKSPNLDSNGFSVVIFTFDADVKEKNTSSLV